MKITIELDSLAHAKIVIDILAILDATTAEDFTLAAIDGLRSVCDVLMPLAQEAIDWDDVVQLNSNVDLLIDTLTELAGVMRPALEKMRQATGS